MEKKVKCRKDHVCACCEQVIKEGQYANYLSFREPRFAGDHETQIGIEYFKLWLHIDPDVCDKFLNEVEKGRVSDSEQRRGASD